MPKLLLVFIDEKGDEQRIEVERTPFLVGRHSECGLTILDSRLSREHLRIEEKDGKFAVSDPGSSNGTTLNGKKLTDQVELKNEDVLDLGGAVVMTAALEADEEDAGSAAGPDAPTAPELPESSAADPSGQFAAAAPQTPAIGAVGAEASPGGIPTALFFIAPLIGLFVLAVVVGAVVLLSGGQQQIAASNGDDRYYSDDSDPTPDKEDEDEPRPRKSATPGGSNASSTDGPVATSSRSSEVETTAPSADTSETAAAERNGSAFVRQIALNDPRAFLTGEQAARVNNKIKQVGRSSSLADNLSSARKNAAAIRTLAEQTNLKPQFLAVAAITKLGGSRGDVLQAAKGVISVYEQLRIQIGNDNFDDALLMVAAYDQGSAGEAMKMRNMLQDLATKSGEGARTIRSIWFLEKNGKISAAEFDRALSFLAIGTIAQNPKDFGVNAEALKL
ncbi:MAG: FHA domain-containing protein [Acidobacteria bacterium]|nr:FHA domain-containing protein [Acidobacteriota bacterium]